MGRKKGENAHLVSKEFTTEKCVYSDIIYDNSVGGKVLGGVGMRLHNIFSFERAKCEMPVADPAMKIILWTEKRGSFTDI